MPVTRYDEVETSRSTCGSSATCGTASTTWGEQVEEWKVAPFDDAQPGADAGTVTKYAKVVSQCEKGLPTNTVLPILAERSRPSRDDARGGGAAQRGAQGAPLGADRDGHPQRRSSAARASHWATCSSCGSTSTRTRSRRSRRPPRRRTCSRRCSPRWRACWKSLELHVNSYKEQKDVFILGGVDDVMAVLEETQVLVQTILGSRFVGPMQKRVDEWDKKLRLFSETLDEWLAVQRAWMYLESIFKARTSSGSCPTSTRTSTRSTRSGWTLMRKTNADPYRAEVRDGAQAAREAAEAPTRRSTRSKRTSRTISR